MPWWQYPIAVVGGLAIAGAIYASVDKGHPETAATMPPEDPHGGAPILRLVEIVGAAEAEDEAKFNQTWRGKFVGVAGTVTKVQQQSGGFATVTIEDGARVEARCVIRPPRNSGTAAEGKRVTIVGRADQLASVALVLNDCEVR
jgi:hypothetical protein